MQDRFPCVWKGSAMRGSAGHLPNRRKVRPMAENAAIGCDSTARLTAFASVQRSATAVPVVEAI